MAGIRLSPDTLLTTDDLTKLFDCSSETIRRAIARGDLPSPCWMFGGHYWTWRIIVRHVDDRLEEAHDAQRQGHSKVQSLRP